MIFDRITRYYSLFWKFVIYVVAITVTTIMSYPLVWMIYSALKSRRAIFMNPWGLPSKFRFEHFITAWMEGGLWLYFLNSTLVTSVSVLVIVFISSMAAFAFARLDFFGREFFFYTFLLGLILPVQAIVLPLYSLLGSLDLLNTYFALIFPYISWGLALSIYILRSFFSTLPSELEDSAKIDGCSLFGIFWRVMLPLVRPALLTVAVLQGVYIWNEFMLAMLFIKSQEIMTLPVGLMSFFGMHQIEYPLLFSALTIAVVPVLIVYFIFQNYIIEGLTVGAID